MRFAAADRPAHSTEPVAALFAARRLLLDVDGPSLRLDRVAWRAGMSPAHFQRQFRHTFGETPHQLQIEARLDRAIHLLRTTSLPVTEICFECGYESLGSFSHLFRRKLGLSPRQFRRERRFWPVNITFLDRLIPFCLVEKFR